MVRLRHAIGHIGVGVDVLVYSEQKLEQRGHIPSSALCVKRRSGSL
jgi:hypothetical protein